MPGSPILHGYQTSSSPAGEGGAARAAAAAPLGADFPTNYMFFIWLVIVGVVIPGLILGGLRVGGFQFVFKGR